LLSLATAIVEVSALASLLPLLSLVSNEDSTPRLFSGLFDYGPLGLVLTFALLPVFGLLALAIVRTLPLAQTAYRGWSMLAAHKRAIDDVDELLSLPLQSDRHQSEPPLSFQNMLEFREVSFRYPGAAREVLDHAGLRIERGEWLRLSGPTGSGKSTVGDLAPAPEKSF
jgi:ABC-type multidrug transport system fused ATPase/permease subunit